MTNALERLARLEGLALEYADIWGTVHRPLPQGLVALLGAMHIDAGDDAAIGRALAAHESRRRLAVLPAAWVRGEHGDRPLPLRTPHALGDDATLEWTLQCEDGRTEGGSVRVDALAPIADATDLGSQAHAHDHDPSHDGSGPPVAARPAARALPLPRELPLGYHRLEVRHGTEVVADCVVIVAPGLCHMPDALEGDGRVWGCAVQLYAVRSARNWGIGDFTDLATLIDLWGEHGAGVIGVNPLHAMFAHNPAHASPYSPSSRLFLNTLYIDVDAVPECAASDAVRERLADPAFRARIEQLRGADLVDYSGVAAAKREILELAYQQFRTAANGGSGNAGVASSRSVAASISDGAAGSSRAVAFAAFRAARGQALHRHALFEALQEHFHRDDSAIWGWPVWPEAFRDPEGDAVRRYAEEHADRVGFHAWLQWQADLQMEAACARARKLHVGLYQDLAVSVDRAGAEAWSGQDLYATTASVGAPPDEFNLQGQNWGLPPPIPRRLQGAAYAPFIDMLRANMRHAGALRIDHVMALMRLYWIAAGDSAAGGSYVLYPFDDLLAIVRLESRRHRCMVIGEDLGTVPPEVREKLGASGILSYRLLFFERDGDGNFRPPAHYPAQALVAGATHDLPTLAGWWESRDLALRERLGLFPDPAMRDAQATDRHRDRGRLLHALEREGLLPAGAGTDPDGVPAMTNALATALQQFLARTPAKVVVAQLEDVIGVRDQINQPGTSDSYPNWQKRLPLALEAWPGDARFLELARMFERERGTAVEQESPLAAIHPSAASSPSTSPSTSISTAPSNSSSISSRPTTSLPLSSVPSSPAPSPSSPAPDSAPALTARIPRATYRVQLHRDFTFADATALVPYLAALGISDLYTSPFLRARAGSRHGYDVVDHGEINPEIGTAAELDTLVTVLHDHGMGLLIDLVPNHMGVLGGDNAWWLDVLEDGPASVHAGYFDIDWRSADPALAGRVLLPVLGDQYGLVLERGELELGFETATGRYTLAYFEHLLPIDPVGYGALLRRALGTEAARRLPAEVVEAVGALAVEFDQLPAHDTDDDDARARRHEDKTRLRAGLAALATAQPKLEQALAAGVAELNGQVGDRGSFDALDALIESQAYRLAQWRIAGDEINYRRFFDVNELAALRMESPEVFEATHRLVLGLAARGAVDGLRIDHPDGLADPAAYFRQLQQRYAELVGAPRPIYVVIEKITAPHEQVPSEWAVHGTTGYRFANVVNGLFIDGTAKTRLDRTWRAYVGDEAEDFDTLAWLCRHIVMDSTLAGELTVLATALLRLARADRRTRDFTLHSLRGALADVVASFPVYRTYVIDKPSAQDRRFIDWAIGRARRRSLGADTSLFDFIRQVLLGRPLPGAPRGLGERYRAFGRRFQQYTAPVAAKGIEDTAFYRHQRLISVNDVGGDPDAFGCTVTAFHAASRDRAQNWPHTMLATSTHDAKRSEDVRARIDVISEMPAAWRLTVRRWARFNRRLKRSLDGTPAPSRNDEYMLYQTLVGSLPTLPLDNGQLAAYADRIDRTMLKSARESKAVTSWINPNAEYETALSAFVQSALAPRDGNLFLDDLKAAAPIFAWYGALNGLSLAVVKCLSPGVPDFYQGHEAIELTLVDPDNREPVDYDRRHGLIDAAREIAAQPDRAASLRALLAEAADGRAKFWTVWQSLQLRRTREAMLTRAGYVALAAVGARAAHVVAFARHDGADWIVVVAPRLYAKLGLEVGQAPLGEVWGDTAIEWPEGVAAPERFVDVIGGRSHRLEGGRLALATLLRDFPVAVLDGQATETS